MTDRTSWTKPRRAGIYGDSIAGRASETGRGRAGGDRPATARPGERGQQATKRGRAEAVGRAGGEASATRQAAGRVRAGGPRREKDAGRAGAGHEVSQGAGGSRPSGWRTPSWQTGHQNGPNLVAGHDDGYVLRAPGADEVVEPGQVLIEHFAVEEQQRPERLILGGGGDPPVDGQRGEELRDLRRPHLGGMALAVEEDVAPDPAHVRLLGPPAVVARLEGLADAVEELRRRRTGRGDLSKSRAGAGWGSSNVTGDGEICATSMGVLPYCFAWRPTITRPARTGKDDSAGRRADERQHLPPPYAQR